MKTSNTMLQSLSLKRQGFSLQNLSVEFSSKNNQRISHISTN